MNYWQIVYRTGETIGVGRRQELATREVIINDDQYKEIQKALIDGQDFVVIEDKPTIKRGSIASINPANDIVLEYQRVGVKIEGLLEPANVLKITGDFKSTKEITEEKLKKMRENLETKDWWK